MKGEFGIKSIMILLVVISGVIIGTSGFYGSLYSAQSRNYTELAYLNSSIEIQEDIEQVKESIEGSQLTGVDILDVPFMIASGVWNSLRLFMGSIDVLTTLVGDMSRHIILPTWTQTMIIGVVTLVIIFAIIGAITKIKGGV